MAKTVPHHSLSLVAALAWASISLTEATAQPAQAYEPYVVTTKSWGPDGLVDKAIPTITFAGPWQSRDSFFGRKEIRVASLADSADTEVDEAKGNADVSASMPWRAFVQALDMHDLSVALVPRDLDRKVGETVAANDHGRCPSTGPVINIINNYETYLSSALVTKVRRHVDPEEGYCLMVPGDFNSIVVVNKVNVALVRNGHVMRVTAVMPADEYPAYFAAHVLGAPAAPTVGGSGIPAPPAVALHEAVLYAPGYDVARSVSWLSTDKPLSRSARLVPWDTKGRTWFADILGWCVLHLPWGAGFRRYVADPLFYLFSPVVRLNFALSGGAGYVLDLDPTTHAGYATQEYDVPTDKFGAFRAKLAAVIARYRVDALNVTVQYSPAETGSMMPWAKTNVFAFCITYRKSGDTTTWSQELIDDAIALGGSFDLASQMDIASVDEILAAYPGAPEFLAQKFLYDNFYRFHNALIDKLCPVEFYEAADEVRRGYIEQEDALFKSYVGLKEKAHGIDLYHLSGVKSLSEIPERRALLGGISAANAALLEAYQVSMKTEVQVSDLKARHMPDYLVRAFMREWSLMDDGIEPHEIDIRTTDQRCFELAAAMLDLAERNWGRWRGDPAGGAPSFDDPTAAAAYRAMSDEIARAGEKMDGDMKAMDRILPMARFEYQ